MNQREVIDLEAAGETPPGQVADEKTNGRPTEEALTTTNEIMGKRKREGNDEGHADDNENYLKAQLREKRAKREMKEAALEVKEAAFEEAEIERKIAALEKKSTCRERVWST